MTTKQAKAFGLHILSELRRDTVWVVKHRVSGETHCHWFRKEEMAKRYSNMIMNATVEAIHFKVGKCKEYGFVDDQIRDVVHP